MIFGMTIFTFVHVVLNLVGILSGFVVVGVLAVAILARYAFHPAGDWRWTYVVSAVMAIAAAVKFRKEPVRAA